MGAVLQCISYAINSARPPFPLMAFAYFLAGLGNAVQNAQGLTIIMSLYNNDNGPVMVGAGCYGTGALIGPLVSTQFAQIPKWNYHFVVTLGVAVVNLVFILAVIRFKNQKGTTHHDLRGFFGLINWY